MTTFRSAFRWMVLLALPSAIPGPFRVVAAQEEVTPVLHGEVLAGNEPLTKGTVVLHLVTAESSGEIDSVTVSPDGTFDLPLPHVPNHAVRQEVYFASVQFRGLHYFGPAITDPIQLDSLYVIQAYDTVSVQPGGAELPLSARSLFLERASDGWDATDVFQVVNSGDRTLYSPTEGVIWSYPLPPSARDFQVGQADMAPDALRFSGGRLELYAPLPPGERFLLIRYHLPEDEPVVPMPGRTDQMDVYVREPGPPAEFPPLVPATPVELDPGNVYRRYEGANLVDTEIRSEVAPEPWSFPAGAAAVLLAGILAGAGVYALRRRAAAGAPDVQPSRGSSREDLLLAVARLDESFNSKKDPSPGAVKEYRARRAKLIRELRERS